MASGIVAIEITLELLQRLSSAPEEGPVQPVTREEARCLKFATPNGTELWSAANKRGIALQKVAAALHAIMRHRSDSYYALVSAACYLKLLGVGLPP